MNEMGSQSRKMRNQHRPARGVLPRSSPCGRSKLRAECLIEGIDPQIEVTARFLQAVDRQVLDVDGKPVSFLVVAGNRYASREEIAEHEMRIPSLPNRTASVKTANCEQAELTENGMPAGTLLWRWEPLHATVEAWTEAVEPGLHRVVVDVANRLEWDADASEQQNRMRSLYSTQLIMHSRDGAFVSLANPPSHLRHHAAACRNDGLWPVPVGEAGDRRTMLASPIHFHDYPDIPLETRTDSLDRQVARTRTASFRNAV